MLVKHGFRWRLGLSARSLSPALRRSNPLGLPGALVAGHRRVYPHLPSCLPYRLRLFARRRSPLVPWPRPCPWYLRRRRNHGLSRERVILIHLHRHISRQVLESHPRNATSKRSARSWAGTERHQQSLEAILRYQAGGLPRLWPAGYVPTYLAFVFAKVDHKRPMVGRAANDRQSAFPAFVRAMV